MVEGVVGVVGVEGVGDAVSRRIVQWVFNRAKREDVVVGLPEQNFLPRRTMLLPGRYGRVLLVSRASQKPLLRTCDIESMQRDSSLELRLHKPPCLLNPFSLSARQILNGV